MSEKTKKTNKQFLGFRMIPKILKISGMGYITALYIFLFLLTALLITLTNPEFSNYADSLWLCFQSITTIGFGDLPTYNGFTRFFVVCISIISIFFLAIITGVVVAFMNDMIKERRGESELAVIHKLENLDKLPKEELKQLSIMIKNRRKK